MSHVVVTGGAGYIGSVLVPELLGRGHRVTVIDRFDRPAFGVTGWIGDPRARLMDIDLLKTSISWRRDQLGEIDVIVHLAAIVGVAACAENPAQTRRDNVAATEWVCGWDAPVITTSTCSNYGVHEGLATEESELNPLSLYARTKIEAEQIVRGAGGVVLRLGTLCGFSPAMRFDLLVNDMVASAVHRHPFGVYGMDAWRPYLHVYDAARAIAHLVEIVEGGNDEACEAIGGKIFNVVAENLTKHALVEQVRGVCPQLALIEGDQDDPRDYRVNGERFRGLEFQFDKTVLDAIRELRQVIPHLSAKTPWRTTI